MNKKEHTEERNSNKIRDRVPWTVQQLCLPYGWNFLFAWIVSMVAMERAVFMEFIQWCLSCFETYRFRILYCDSEAA